jgi:hypothetical protein
LEIKQVTKINKILTQLEVILKDSFPDYTDRKIMKETLLKKLESSNFVRICLHDNSSLILLKDERKFKSLRRFDKSPFPLLTNIEYFSTSTGDWNSELKQFGIKARHKQNDPYSDSTSGIRIHLVKYDTLNNQSNKYLKRQYTRLENYRKSLSSKLYLNLAWTMMTKSWSFKLASLNSWEPLWYKNLTLLELRRIWKGLHKILNLEEQKALVKFVWIESPLGKWRQLGIPSKSWRLYLHMLNLWITYIYDPELPPETYDGFIFNRGCKSWWEYILWSPLLKTHTPFGRIGTIWTHTDSP